MEYIHLYQSSNFLLGLDLPLVLTLLFLVLVVFQRQGLIFFVVDLKGRSHLEIVVLE